MILDVTWRSVEERLQELAEGGSPDANTVRQDAILAELGLIDSDGLTPEGDRLYMAMYVTQDGSSAREALADTLKRQPIINALLEALWPIGTAPVSGGVNMLKRLTRHPDEPDARRLLGVLNTAGLIAYNRNKPTMRVLFNPTELVPQDEDEARERDRGHVLDKDTPFGNLMALRELLRAARNTIRWWEQHMPPKVLEVLYRELDGEKVQTVCLLSGPANITQDLKDDFKRFRAELKKQRGIDAQWRVLTRQEAFTHHDRFFLTAQMSRNLPPLNTILAGSTGEILPSELTDADFDRWWADGTDLARVQIADGS